MGTIRVDERTLAELIIYKKNYIELQKEIQTLYNLMIGMICTFEQDVEDSLKDDME